MTTKTQTKRTYKPRLKWAEPPAPQGGGRGRPEGPKATAMRANPGRSLLIAENSNTRSNGQNYASKGFKVTTRTNPDGTYNVYACWPKGRK